MAKFTFDESQQLTSSSQERGRVGFFNLKADGEESIVRFIVDSMDDIDIYTIHEVQSAGKFMKVSCNRGLNEGLDKCPLCANGTKLTQKAYIKMLQYSTDDNGTVICSPVIWERSTQYAVKLREYLNNYGPLSDIICKVIRHGGRGDLKTNYEIVPNLSKVVYPDAKFVKDTSAFANYNVLGTIVKEKSAEDMITYINTGSFPQTQQNQQTANGGFVADTDIQFGNTGFTNTPNGYVYTGDVVQQTVTSAPFTTAPQQNGVPVQQTTTAMPQQRMPWQNTANQVQRPIRTYN